MTAPKNQRLSHGSEEEPAPKRWRRPALFAKVEEAGAVDAILFATFLTILVFGLVMVYSASGVRAERLHGNSLHFLARQSIFAGAALVVVIVVASIDYRRFRAFTYPVLAGVSGLLLFTLTAGRSAGGATRWIEVGSFNMQPAEMAKLAIILWLAYSLSRKQEKIRSFSIGFLPHILIAGVMMFLCLKQPDFGSAVVIGLLTATMLFVSGTRLNYLLGTAALIFPIAYAVITNSEYRMRRLRGFRDPEATRFDESYQLYESLIGFGSGGVRGVGLGEGKQKLFFLPEAHNDFIGAIIGEELGFIGVAAVILAFLLIVYRGAKAAFNAPDTYGAYLAVGICVFLGVQALTNFAVAMGVLPTKGLVLPFISYGGSSLLVNAAAIGLLLNISRPRRPAETSDDGLEASPEGRSNARRHAETQLPHAPHAHGGMA